MRLLARERRQIATLEEIARRAIRSAIPIDEAVVELRRISADPVLLGVAAGRASGRWRAIPLFESVGKAIADLLVAAGADTDVLTMTATSVERRLRRHVRRTDPSGTVPAPSGSQRASRRPTRPRPRRGRSGSSCRILATSSSSIAPSVRPPSMRPRGSRPGPAQARREGPARVGVAGTGRATPRGRDVGGVDDRHGSLFDRSATATVCKRPLLRSGGRTARHLHRIELVARGGRPPT